MPSIFITNPTAGSAEQPTSELMAFIVPVPQKVLDDSNLLHSQANIGKRGDIIDGTPDNQLVGMIGENMILHYLLNTSMKKLEGTDEGYDLSICNKRFDVKTMGRNSVPTIEQSQPIFEHQINAPVDAYIFLNYIKPTTKMAVCGWLPKHLFMERSTYYPAGYVKRLANGKEIPFKSGNYEVPNSSLMPCTSFLNLITEIFNYYN